MQFSMYMTLWLNISTKPFLDDKSCLTKIETTNLTSQQSRNCETDDIWWDYTCARGKIFFFSFHSHEWALLQFPKTFKVWNNIHCCLFCLVNPIWIQYVSPIWSPANSHSPASSALSYKYQPGRLTCASHAWKQPTWRCYLLPRTYMSSQMPAIG